MKARVEKSRGVHLLSVAFCSGSSTWGHAGTSARKRIAEDLYAAASDHLYRRMESSS
jgi:hypothetical protein